MADPVPDFDDPFAPDPNSTAQVFCLHCETAFEERQVVWKRLGRDWLWCCPTEGCDGAGVGFDILHGDPKDLH